MARRDRRHGSGAFLRWFPVVLVLALLASAGAAYRFDLGERWLGTGPDPDSEPAAVAPPEGVELPELADPPVLAASSSSSSESASRREVRRALAPLLRDDDLGPHLVSAVAELDGDGLLSRTGRGTATPASTLKLLTATAALQTLGPDHVFSTTTVGAGRRVVLVGGGDPLLSATRDKQGDDGAWPARADVVSLARATARALERDGRRQVSLSYDDTLFSGPSVDPRWPTSYVPDVVAPISALWVDEGADPDGFGHVLDPAKVAAERFAEALADAGITVVGSPRPGRARDGMTELARVSGAPLSQVVERVLSLSDNEGAEVLARHVGLATEGVGSSAAGSRGTRDTLASLGVDLTGAEIYDGSGLSRDNRLTATTLVDVLKVVASADRPDLRAVVTGLPVAGFSGSLSSRFESGAKRGRGLVRAKTGTLSGVSALAGIVTDLDGQSLVFVLVADDIDLPDTLDARAALDEAAAALAACHCAA